MIIPSFREFLLIDEDVAFNVFLLDQLSESHEWGKAQIVERKDPYTDPDQPWSGVPANIQKDLQSGDAGKKSSALEYIKKIYDQAMAFVEKNERAFSRMLQLEGAGGKVLISVKKLGSFVSKVMERGKDPKQVHDVLRGAILLNSTADVERVVNSIKKRYRIFEVEYKDRDNSNEYGYYGSYHFKIFVGSGSDGMICELQVMTKKLWAYKAVAHDIYSKWRDAKDADNDVKAQDIAWSRELFRLGNR